MKVTFIDVDVKTIFFIGQKYVLFACIESSSKNKVRHNLIQLITSYLIKKTHFVVYSVYIIEH